MLLAEADNAPTWTDKLEAWSTFGGAIFTAAAVIVAFMVWRHDQRLRREDRQNAEASQARLVFAAVTGAVGDPTSGWDGITFAVSNNSEAPIYAVRVTVDMETIYRAGLSKLISVVPASTTEEGQAKFPGALEWPFQVVPPDRHDLRRRVDIQVSFTDSAGRSWTRSGMEEPLSNRMTLHTPGLASLIAQFLGLIGPGRSLSATMRRGRARLINWFERRLEARAKKRRDAASPWTLPPPL